jgi:hypothetical protein
MSSSNIIDSFLSGSDGESESQDEPADLSGTVPLPLPTTPLEDVAVGTTDAAVDAATAENDATPGGDGGQTGLQQVGEALVGLTEPPATADDQPAVDLDRETIDSPDRRTHSTQAEGFVGDVPLGPPTEDEGEGLQQVREERLREKGPLDEAITRTFWSNPELTRTLDEKISEGDAVGILGGTTELAAEFTFDNPGFTVEGKQVEPSLQGGVQGAMLEAYKLGGAPDDATIEDLARDYQKGARGVLQSAGVLHPANYVPSIDIGPANTKEAASYAGDFAGGVADALGSELISSGSAVLTGIEPLPNYNAMQKPAEADVTGDTEATPPPEEYVPDILAYGWAARGGRLAARSGRLGRLLDRLPGRAPSSGADEATAAAAGAATGASMSGAIDELAQLGARGADEVPSILRGGDETVQAGTSQAAEAQRLTSMSFDEVVRQGPTDIGVSDEFTLGTQTAFDEAAPAADAVVDDIVENVGRPSGTDLGARTTEELSDISIPEGVTQSFDEGGILGDEFASGAGEASAGILSTTVRGLDDAFGGVFRGGDETVSASTRAGEDVAEESGGVFSTAAGGLEDAFGTGGRFFDEGTSAGDEAVGAGGRLFDEGTSAGDEAVGAGSRFFDEGTSAGDEAAGAATRAGEDAAQSGDELAAAGRGGDGGGGGGGGGLFGGGGGDGGGLLSRLFSTRGVLLSGGALAAGGLVLSSLNNGEERTGEGGFAVRKIADLTANNRSGALCVVMRRGTTLGYTVYVGRRTVLTQSGGTQQVSVSTSDIQNQNFGPDNQPKAVFDSRQQARRAFQTWAEGGGGNNNTNPSDVWDGSLDAPNSVKRGEGFAASAEVRNTVSSQANANFILGLRASDGTEARLGNQRARVSSNSSTTLEFNVRQRTKRLPEGEYQLSLFADGDGAGRVASTRLDVTGSDDPTGGEWNTQMLGELGAGWYLARQTRGEEQRFIVVGKREDGTRIYIYPGGQVRQSPHYFGSRADAESAFQAWAQRHQQGETSDGETPSRSAGRPTEQGVARDAQTKDSGLVSGLSSTLTSPAGIAGLVVLAAAIWYVSDGEPIAWLESQANSVYKEVT